MHAEHYGANMCTERYGANTRDYKARFRPRAYTYSPVSPLYPRKISGAITTFQRRQ